MNIWLARIFPLACLCIAVLFGIAAYRKQCGGPVRLMVWLAAFVFAYEAAGHYLGYHHNNNLWLYNFATLCWVTGICYYYHSVLKSRGFRSAVLILAAAYFLISLPMACIYTFSSEGLNTPGITAGGVLVIICSLMYLLEQNKTDTTESFFRNPHYFFSIAFILYFAMLIFMNGMYNFLLENYISDGLNQFIIYLPIFTSFLYNVFISLGFICCLRNTKYT